MSTLITSFLAVGLLAAVAAVVVLRRRHRQRLEQRRAAFEQRLADLQERQTAQVDRLRRERDRIERTGHLELAGDLLEVIDDFDNALDQYDDLADQHREGLALTRRKLLRALDDHGIERIEPTASEAFDPEHHEALRAVEPEEAKPGTVVRCHRPGYRFDDRILRPAAVDVAVGRESRDTPDDAPAPDAATADDPPARADATAAAADADGQRAAEAGSSD